MATISAISAGKAILNTIIRLTPIGLYSGSAMSAFLFNDFRATIVFAGLMLNEGIALGYRMIMKGIYNPQCALLQNEEDYFVLPSPITQTVGFLVGFFLAKMFNDGEFLPFRFFTMFVILLLTIFSRINVGCKGFPEAIYCALLGMILGVGYFNLIKDYYRRDFYKTDDTTDTQNLTDFFKLD